LKLYAKITLIVLGLILSHGDGDHSHSHSKLEKGSISGIVIDKNTLDPIEFTSISVYSIEDNSMISGGISNKEGVFYIDQLYPGKYKIIAEFIGYESIEVSGISLNPEKGMKHNTGKIKLIQKSIDIDAVKVVDDKPIYEFETDKLVYNVSDDIISGSGSAEDVLKKTPMVTLNQDGEIMLRGSTDVRILVNGRPIRSEVGNISAATIEKVEVITSPSAKYDPEGMAGIINIELKKGDYEGFNGSLRLNTRNNDYHSWQDMNGMTFYTNYRKGKYNFYSSLSNNNRRKYKDGYRNTITEYYTIDQNDIDPVIDEFKYSYNESDDKQSNMIELGLDYYLTDELTLNWELGFDSHLKEEDGSQIINDGNDIFQTGAVYDTKEVDDRSNYDSEGMFELTKTFIDYPEREFSLSFSHHNHDDLVRESLSLDLDGLDNDRSDMTVVTNDLDMYEFELNYKLPINELEKIEFGYDGDFVKTLQSMDFELAGMEGVNDFDYSRDIHAIYLEYERKVSDKFSIKPSIRYEHINKSIISEINNFDDSAFTGQSTLGQYILYNYNNNPNSIVDIERKTIYPDLHFAYNLNAKQSIQFGVSKRVERPGSFGHGWGQRKIRPFPRDIYSEGRIFIGNPELEPEYSTMYDLSFKSPAPMGFFTTSLFYSEIEDKVEWDPEFIDTGIGENVSVLTFNNANKAYQHGMSFFVMLAGQVLGGTWKKDTVYDLSDDTDLNEGSTFQNMYFQMRFPEEYMSPFIKWWKFDFEYGFYWMKIKSDTGDYFGKNGTLWGELSLSKQFLNNRLRVAFNINNLHDKPGFQMLRTSTLSPEDYDTDLYTSVIETEDSYNRRDGRTVSLSFRYNFGKLEEDKGKSRRKSFGGEGGRSMDMDMGF